MVEEVFDVTGDKEWLKESYKTLAKEYEFWQTERIAPNGLNIYGPHKDYSADKIERFSKYFLDRFKGYEFKNEEAKVNAAHTIFTICESGWDCNSRFENAGEFYNPVDLNSLRNVLMDLLGMKFDVDGIHFKPCGTMLVGDITAEGICYRNAVLDISVKGHGGVKSFKLDGEATQPFLPADTCGKHTVEIILEAC